LEIELTNAEALVLFERLKSFEEREGVSGTSKPKDAAEQIVLWRIEGQLGRTLVKPFDSISRARREAAKREVRESQ